MANKDISSQLPKHIDGSNLFLGEGENFENSLEETSLPDITAKTEELYTASGLAPVKVPVGYEGMEISFNLLEPSDTILTRVGTRDLAIFKGTLYAQNCNEEESYVIKVFGLIEKYEGGSHKGGEAGGKPKFTISIDNITYEREGKEVLHINNITGEKRIFGEECTRKRRQNLGTNS